MGSSAACPSVGMSCGLWWFLVVLFCALCGLLAWYLTSYIYIYNTCEKAKEKRALRGGPESTAATRYRSRQRLMMLNEGQTNSLSRTPHNHPPPHTTTHFVKMQEDSHMYFGMVKKEKKKSRSKGCRDEDEPIDPKVNLSSANVLADLERGGVVGERKGLPDACVAPASPHHQHQHHYHTKTTTEIHEETQHMSFGRIKKKKKKKKKKAPGPTGSTPTSPTLDCRGDSNGNSYEYGSEYEYQDPTSDYDSGSSLPSMGAGSGGLSPSSTHHDSTTLIRMVQGADLSTDAPSFNSATPSTFETRSGANSRHGSLDLDRKKIAAMGAGITIVGGAESKIRVDKRASGGDVPDAVEAPSFSSGDGDAPDPKFTIPSVGKPSSDASMPTLDPRRIAECAEVPEVRSGDHSAPSLPGSELNNPETFSLGTTTRDTPKKGTTDTPELSDLPDPMSFSLGTIGGDTPERKAHDTFGGDLLPDLPDPTSFSLGTAGDLPHSKASPVSMETVDAPDTERVMLADDCDDVGSPTTDLALAGGGGAAVVAGALVSPKMDTHTHHHVENVIIEKKKVIHVQLPTMEDDDEEYGKKKSPIPSQVASQVLSQAKAQATAAKAAGQEPIEPEFHFAVGDEKIIMNKEELEKLAATAGDEDSGSEYESGDEDSEKVKYLLVAPTAATSSTTTTTTTTTRDSATPGGDNDAKKDSDAIEKARNAAEEALAASCQEAMRGKTSKVPEVPTTECSPRKESIPFPTSLNIPIADVEGSNLNRQSSVGKVEVGKKKVAVKRSIKAKVGIPRIAKKTVKVKMAAHRSPVEVKKSPTLARRVSAKAIPTAAEPAIHMNTSGPVDLPAKRGKAMAPTLGSLNLGVGGGF